MFLNWQSDEDCVTVAEFVMHWIQSDLSAAINLEAEAKDISLFAFLSDILVCVDGDNSERAQEILSQIGQ